MLPFGTQIAQLRPSGTSATAAFSSAIPDGYTISKVIVANVSGASASYTLYHDADGSTFDETTTLFPAVPLAANACDIIDFSGKDDDGLVLERPGQIGVKTDTGSAITFTFYGRPGVAR